MKRWFGNLLCSFGFHKPGGDPHAYFEFDAIKCARLGCFGMTYPKGDPRW